MSETQSAERYPGDYYELEKLRIRQQMQEDITSWAKRRFAVMGVLIGVLGLFGLSTVIHQSVRLMTERPIQREVERVVKATDHAREIIFELDKLSEEATEAASQARDAATASKKGLEEYQKALAALKTELRDIERQSDLLEERFGAASKNIKQVAAVIFEAATRQNITDRETEFEINKLSNHLIGLEKLVLGALKVRDSDQTAVLFETFQTNKGASAAAYDEERTKLYRNTDFNVVVYIQRGQGFERSANEAVAMLNRQGYRAAVWLAHGKDAASAAADVRTEFPNLVQELNETRRALIIHPSHSGIGEEIRGLLQGNEIFANLSVITANMKPVDRHLSTPNGTSYRPENVILIYATGV